MIKIEAAQRLLATMDSRIFYRGLEETWSDDYAKNQHLIFITPDKKYALEYAKNPEHLLSFHADLGHSFDFGFRTQDTYVKLDDVKSRIKQGILDQFSNGHISKESGKKLFDELEDVQVGGRKHANGMKPVWEWYMENPELCKILAKAGFNSIECREGVNSDIQTYGVFSSKQLVPIKE